MALVKMSKLLKNAKENGVGVGSFSIYNMEALMGAVKAVENRKTPAIFQLAEKRFRTAPLELVGPMMIQAAKESQIDIAVHLDHSESFDVIRKALELGFTSVMFDGSPLPFEKNIEGTIEAKKIADEFGADLEAELGLVGKSEDGTVDHGVKWTVPSDAKIFVEETGIDILAVAIGNQHGNYKEPPSLRVDILDEIRNLLPDKTLVLHGGSGISDDDFRNLIRHGITKVNIATAILNAEVSETEKYLAEAGEHNYYDMNARMVQGAFETVAHHIDVFNLK